MFPREARKTRSTSRSSSVRTQNSHEANEPDSSVSHEGHVSLVTASRELQTGQLLGGRRVGLRAKLFDLHTDAAHRAFDFERACPRADLRIVAVRADAIAEGDLAHRVASFDADAGGEGKGDLALADPSADRARCRIEPSGRMVAVMHDH